MSDRRAGFPAVALSAAALCCGCYNTVYVASANGYVNTKRTGKGRPFAVKIRNDFGFWGITPQARIIEVDRVVSYALGREIRYITGLRITQHLMPADAVAYIFTLGLYSPRTVVIEGETHETMPVIAAGEVGAGRGPPGWTAVPRPRPPPSPSRRPLE